MPGARSGRGVAELLFERADFSQAPDVPFLVGELRPKEGVYAFAGGLDADDASAQNQHVHVVMLYALVSGIIVVAKPRADTADFVGGDAGAHSAATNEYAAFGLMSEKGASYFFGVVGIIDRRRGVRAHVENLVSLLL